MPFIMNQHVYAVFLGEAFDKIVLVFPNTPRKIAGYTRVQGPVAFACQNVHGGVFLPHRFLLDSRLRGNDGLL